MVYLLSMDNTQVATKADIQQLEQSTKADISTVRSELKDVRSELKAEIKAVKTELKSDIKSLRQEILRVEEKVEKLEEDIKEFKIDIGAKLDRLQNTMDGFIGAVDDLRTDNTVGTHHTRELQKRVDDHEARLQQIESAKHTA